MPRKNSTDSRLSDTSKTSHRAWSGGPGTCTDILTYYRMASNDPSTAPSTAPSNDPSNAPKTPPRCPDAANEKLPRTAIKVVDNDGTWRGGWWRIIRPDGTVVEGKSKGRNQLGVLILQTMDGRKFRISATATEGMKALRQKRSRNEQSSSPDLKRRKTTIITSED